MKKLIKSALCIMAVLSVLALSGCGEKTVKFGVGSYTSYEKRDSLDGNDGKAKSEVTVAAVLLDGDGKIVDCAIDSIDIEAKFNSKGEASDLDELKSKRQLGDSYGMKKYAKAEWYEEVDSFIGVIKGKTLSDVKALVATDKKGTDTVTNAGCTIKIDGFVMALEKAFNNAKELEAKKESKLKLDLSAKQTEKKNATDDNNGEVKAEVSYTAKLTDKSNTVKSYTDKLEAKAKFDNKGKNID